MDRLYDALSFGSLVLVPLLLIVLVVCGIGVYLRIRWADRWEERLRAEPWTPKHLPRSPHARHVHFSIPETITSNPEGPWTIRNGPHNLPGPLSSYLLHEGDVLQVDIDGKPRRNQFEQGWGNSGLGYEGIEREPDIDLDHPSERTQQFIDALQQHGFAMDGADGRYIYMRPPSTPPAVVEPVEKWPWE